MIFDQYSRYKACSDLIRLAGFSPGNSVLDVGSGPECLFGQFMPDAAMTYVDPLLPDGSDPTHIAGDVFTARLDGRVFDCVSSVDVLEHVPPEHRQALLQRLSSLCRSTLVIGFPTVDSSDAGRVDRAIEDQYREAFARDYPWLDEHHRYGLPSLAETVQQLVGLGWHCHTVGHGHAPWLEELLGFVICVWDIPELRDIVLNASERFNRDLYANDYSAPHYRQFVIATRSPQAPVNPGPGAKSREEADRIFRTIMDDAHRQQVAAGIRQILDLERRITQCYVDVSQRDGVIGSLTTKLEEISAWAQSLHADLVARDALLGELNVQVAAVSAWGQKLQGELVERDGKIVNLNEQIETVSRRAQSATTERDAAVAETGRVGRERDDMARLVDLMRGSLSWRITMPLRLGRRLLRHGLAGEDRRMVVERLHSLYRRLPLPQAVRQMVGEYRYRRRHGQRAALTVLSSSIAPVSHEKTNGLAIQQPGFPDYIVWGVIDWHFRHQRPQQIAQALAGSGRRVFYVSEALIDSATPGFAVEPLDDTGRLFSIRLHVKGAPVIYRSVPTSAQVANLRRSAGELLAWANSCPVVSLVQHPFWLGVASVLPGGRMVYDCMDHHEGFGNVPPEMIAMERALLAGADLTITTSTWLDEIVADKTAHRAIVRNAGEFRHFAHPAANVHRDPKGRPIIGYYGAIAEWFDIELVEKIATQFPGCCVLLIGADTVGAKTRLGKFPNVEFTGEIPYAELPRYLHAFAVCMLPFQVIPLTLATNPVKVYEYLSAGKPVVVVDLPEMGQFGELVDVARDHDDYLAAVARRLGRTDEPEEIVARQAFGRAQTWSHRAEALVGYAESAGNDPWVSVIVLTYNNLELTKACLASIDLHSHYKNLEIIVVDNASSDESPAFLAEWVTQGSNRKLVLNEKNKGFAAGNNDGLAIATGDYLVLLNNDTYVTPGWIRTMVNHMRRDPGLGLLGPGTNNIGNEARIEIAYANMEEMLVQASAYTRNHLGQVFPLRTAAFFCVMITRKAYEAVGGLDEAFGRGFFEDDDYCRRVEQIGLRIACAEDVFVHHHLSASFSKLKHEERQRLFEDNRRTYEAKWGAWIPHEYKKSVDPISSGQQRDGASS